jgi:hypothetical protein
MGVPVSNPFRACERYHAAWLYLKADLGNCALTAARFKPGNYTLQLQIKDKVAKGKNNTAAQALQFEIADR